PPQSPLIRGEVPPFSSPDKGRPGGVKLFPLRGQMSSGRLKEYIMSNLLGLEVKKIVETTPEEVERVHNWINTDEYKEKNFARQALVINPAHACQPLGAQLAAHGFEGTLPFVHGSQGCASYYRSTLNRHFREPAPAVSDSMTEDGAVFGGQNNLHEGLENAIAIYKPKMVSIFTSCMPEIIGDDLVAFLKNARNKGIIPEGMPVPFANT